MLVRGGVVSRLYSDLKGTCCYRFDIGFGFDFLVRFHPITQEGLVTLTLAEFFWFFSVAVRLHGIMHLRPLFFSIGLIFTPYACHMKLIRIGYIK